DNPNAIAVQNFQVRFSVNVWCGMIDGMLIGPVILQNRMTGQSYFDFLQNTLPPQLEDISLATRRTIYFQHDGAPPHNTHLVAEHIDAVFSHRWIGGGETVQWPPRSPDLTPMDFCLWGWLKYEVYKTKVNTQDELFARVIAAVDQIR
ncbi:hypothetical protein EAI_12527, partial [Harpegnathos saltator]